jgi:hypothetical protein
MEMVDKYMTKRSTSLYLEEMKIISLQSQRQSSRKQMLTKAGKDAGEKNPVLVGM